MPAVAVGDAPPPSLPTGLLRFEGIEFPGEGVEPSVDAAVVSEGSSSPAGFAHRPGRRLIRVMDDHSFIR